MDMLGKILDTKDKMTKMTILLASSALLILVIKNNEKMLTTKLTNSLLLLVVLGSLFLGYLINEEPDEEIGLAENFKNEWDDSLSDLSLTNSTISEPFQDMPNDPALNLEPAPPFEFSADPEPDSLEQEENLMEPPNEPYKPEIDNVSVAETNVSVAESNVSVAPSESDADNFAPVDLGSDPKKLPESCFPKDILNASELLPKDGDNAWAENVPAGQGELKDQNFLNAGYHVGVNTVGQSLRNANRQLRSDPPCPQVKVSPWLQSTIEPDMNRRALEIK